MQINWSAEQSEALAKLCLKANNNLITESIKWFRSITGFGLKASKEIIEVYYRPFNPIEQIDRIHRDNVLPPAI